MTDSTRFSAAAGLPTPVERGTPAGLPTPAGEPTEATLPFDQPKPETLLRGKVLSEKPGPAANDAGRTTRTRKTALGGKTTPQKAPQKKPAAKDPRRAIGALVIAWGMLEAATIEKLVTMRRSFGDVRAVGGRSRPTLQRLLAELRALVAMRDRHDKQILTVIATLDADLQRLAQFRGMVVDGTQRIEGEGLICHDLKNVEHQVSVETILGETQRIDEITAQIAAL
ncbi:hypothetical protein [Sphingobium sp. CR28]|uniref:hypothetical protein n=1 Tax=Sphingobium sp. CR28 TaxID=3400272 RepID=UPI003FF10438